MRALGRRARIIALLLVAYLVAGLLGGPIAAAAELELRKLQEPDPVPVSAVKGHKLNKPDETKKHPFRPDTRASWPTPGMAVVPVGESPRKPGRGKAGSLPVAAAEGKESGKRAAVAAEQAQVQILDRSAAQAAGVDGILVAVRGHGDKKGKAAVGVTLDYSSFAGMYGGDWASRLTFREVPACALTTPGKKGCAPGRSLPSHNDAQRETLSAEIATDVTTASADETGQPVQQASPVSRIRTSTVADGATLLAVTAAPSGANGTFSATSLSPSGKWEVGGSSGGFSWSYDLQTPDVPGGLGPDLGLSYSSLAIDGRTAATNNQANWVGDGWSLSPGFIERRYTSCQDDKSGGNNPSHKVGDQCWKTDNATLSLGGSSGELVKDDATGVWKKKIDDGTRVERFHNSALANGDNDNEYWRVTAPDGTRYYFGYNRPNGWAEGKAETNSTWTVPVFGNHAGEPCHASAFKDSWCRQAWRWNLDAVIDPHGNAMTYYWAKESNHYQRNIDALYKGTLTSYDRGGYLKRIEYGLRSSNFYGTPAAKADFTVAERCLPTESFDCAAGKFTESNAKNWPDVPFDQYCDADDACESNSSPSYFTRKRLTGVSTSVRNAGAYQKVDSWAFTHQFPSTGDGTDPALWLASITRTGHTSGTPVTLPAVTFKGRQMPNRVAAVIDEIPDYNRYRVYAVNTETGSTIGVTYSAPDCSRDSLPSPSSNTRRCYPVIWSPPDAPAENYEPYQDWFHSYVVTQILESDNTSGAPVKRTDYSYPGGLAWAKNDDEFTKAKHRTYGDRKGYARVQVRTGDPAEGQQTLSETRYFRGIAGAKVADGEGNEVADHEAFSGMVREEATHNGSGGALVSATSYTPWRSAPIATRSRSADNLPTVYAYRTGTAKEQTRTTITGGNLRRSETSRTFDSYGMVASESQSGDLAKSGDERCTTTSYARNTGKNILNTVSESTTVAKACGTTPSLPADLVGIKRNYYDGSTTLGAAPSKGAVTRSDENDGAGTGFVTVSKAAYDAYGRQTEATDAAGATTTTAYTPTTGQIPTETTTTNALGHTAKTITDPRRGLTTATVDANGKRTDMEYDALGRLLKGWGPGWAKADHPTQPTAEFAYRVSRSEPNVVTTKVLNYQGYYETSYTFYDGLTRPRQTQTAAIGVSDGRIVTETRYDTRGQVWKSYGAYYAAGAPTATLVEGDDSKTPAGAETKYDGAGRTTAVISLKFGDETKRTVTQYAGDRTTVIPPQGGTAVTTIVDALGRKTTTRSYTNAARTEFQDTTYAYNKHDKLARMTDPAGISWTWTYDARARLIEADDPDKGVSRTTYDAADRPVTTTDARGITLTTTHDKLGRPTQLKQGSTVRASWAYDTVAKGKPASDTRYLNGEAYTTKINTYNDQYQPTSSTTTLPAGSGSLAGSYTWTFGYNQYTGVQEWVKHPTLGNLRGERQTTVFGQGNLPQTTSAGGVVMVNATNYDVYGRQIRTEYGTLGQKLYRTQDFDEHTGQLIRSTVDGDIALRVEDTRYGYDPAGNTTRISSTSGQDAAAVTDTQCFSLDALRRMTEAWTTQSPTDNCLSGPSASTVGGPDSFWHSYSYDAAGNRTKETRHATATGSSDITRTYSYDPAATTAPHAVRSVSTTGGADNGKTESFSYDAAGNTDQRTGGARDQDLTWDAEGHLAKVVEDGKTTEYLYDSAGNRMLAKNADGSTVAYLPGGNELKVTAAGTKTATRYYTHGGETVAVRTSEGISFLFADTKGTALIAVTMGAAQTVTRRKQLPFGASRSTTGISSWPGDRGFVGGTTDPTGLTHLGAREYDPVLGRFLSVDPLLITEDPTQHNPYVYGNNNPATFADPTGEAYPECASGQYHCTYGKGGSGDIKTITYGKNYEKVTKSVGGTLAPSYVKYRNKMQYACSKDPSCKSWDGSHITKAARAAERAALAAEKARQEKEKKESGFWSSLKRGDFKGAWDASGGKVVSATHDFIQDNSTLLGWIGVGLGIASMITPLGWFAGAALVGGLVLGAVTTADACLSSQWGSCVMGAASLGMAGTAVGASRLASSALREAATSGFIMRPVFKGAAYFNRALEGIANVASVGFATAGTVTGGNLGDNRKR
ncbi:RHS repeat domain-containing protein [Streptomyces sp. KLOTTS4A1]|uniref:RHS repeat domain-containing protein n=1 Tax=Streptomyces sp. KLOTTS4A1 TaxID=3390996 RepID=UPI0039F56524